MDEREYFQGSHPRMLMGVVLALWLLCGSAYASQQQQPVLSVIHIQVRPLKTARSSEQYLTGTGKKSLVVQVRNAQADKATATQNETNEAEHLHNEDWIAYGTVALALITAVLAFFTFRLWKDARTDSNRQREEVKKSLAIARESADAARDAVRVAFQEQRAYIFAEHVDNNGEGWKRGGTRFEWKYKITNYGKTPAIIKDIRALVAISDVIPSIDGGHQDGNPVFPIFPFGKMEAVQIPPSYILAANGSVEYTAEAQGGFSALVGASELDGQPEPFQKWQRAVYPAINSPLPGDIPGIPRFWLMVKVTYESVFRHSHETMLCFRGTAGITSHPYEEAGGEIYNHRT